MDRQEEYELRQKISDAIAKDVRCLRTTLTFGGRNLVRCFLGMEVMNMPMIVYTRRRI